MGPTRGESFLDKALLDVVVRNNSPFIGSVDGSLDFLTDVP